MEQIDFRPISITTVLTRVIERIVVRDYIYPALLNPPLSFHSLISLPFVLLV